MATKVKLSNAGFQVQQFQDQPTRWGVTSEVYKRQTRFIRFIHESMACKSDAPGCLAARMVAIDGIKPSHIQAIDAQNAVPYRTAHGIAIDWLALEPMRWERRLLSSITLNAWPGQQLAITGPCVSPFPPLAMNPCTDLEKYLAACEPYRRVKSPLQELELDAMSWWQEVLPASLFGHCSETLVLSALPRSALARLECRLALAPTDAADVTFNDAGVASDLVDAAMVSQGPDNSTALIDTVLDILKKSTSEIDGVNKRHWSVEIQKLTNRAINAGPRTALLLAWAADMCESGTIEELNPADSTVSAYIRRALMPLHQVLIGLSDELEGSDWCADNLRMRYQQLVASQSTGNQATMRAALTNFHHFLVTWLDIEPLKTPLPGITPSAPVGAQVVWQHELDLAMQWAAEQDDRDMGMAAQIILGIAFEAPARAQELTRLRLCNLSFSKDDKGQFVEIEIARHAATGRLKTPSSQRRLLIRGPRLLALLANWLEQRKGQGAPNSAFLFGDPNDDSERYRPAATLALVSRLLKAVSGDPRISTHSLRHTAVSNLISEVWMSMSDIDINRTEVVAAHAGHASGLTTLGTYSHPYEHALRTWLDQALREHVEISSQVAADLLNLKSDTLRKHASRAAKDVSGYSWDVLLQLTKAMGAQRASLPFSWHTPLRPPNAPSSARELTVSVMESVLREALIGASVASLARRYRLDEQALDVTLTTLVTKCIAQAARVFPRKVSSRPTPLLKLASSLSVLGIDFERRSQSKYHAFAKGLDGRIEDSQLLRGLESWERCYRGIYVAAERPSEVLGLLSLLKSGNVAPTALRVCMQSSELAEACGGDDVSNPVNMAIAFDSEQVILREKVKRAFEAVFNSTPQITPVRTNRDVPLAYLRWDSGAKTGRAAGTTAGLSAYMICIRAYLIYKESL